MNKLPFLFGLISYCLASSSALAAPQASCARLNGDYTVVNQCQVAGKQVNHYDHIQIVQNGCVSVALTAVIDPANANLPEDPYDQCFFIVQNCQTYGEGCQSASYKSCLAGSGTPRAPKVTVKTSAALSAVSLDDRGFVSVLGCELVK